jgi:hypothetical protein
MRYFHEKKKSISIFVCLPGKQMCYYAKYDTQCYGSPNINCVLYHNSVDLEQSNAEYDITHVVDSSTVDLEQSNAEFDITHVVDSSTVELEQTYDEFHITHNVESSTVEHILIAY